MLDFWATWCGPCIEELPSVKAAFEKFKDNPKFALVSLSLDQDKATPKDYVEKNKMGWTHGFLGEWSKTDIPNAYGVQGIPALFLIGPDGKVVASGMRGAEIESAVERALQKP